jgi:hypothetical protein
VNDVEFDVGQVIGTALAVILLKEAELLVVHDVDVRDIKLLGEKGELETNIAIFVPPMKDIKDEPVVETPSARVEVVVEDVTVDIEATPILPLSDDPTGNGELINVLVLIIAVDPDKEDALVEADVKTKLTDVRVDINEFEVDP